MQRPFECTSTVILVRGWADVLSAHGGSVAARSAADRGASGGFNVSLVLLRCQAKPRLRSVMDVFRVHEQVITDYRAFTSGFVAVRDRRIKGLVDEQFAQGCAVGLIRGWVPPVGADLAVSSVWDPDTG